ncbi:STAS domain-containing protein [Baekduia soli]|uniref:Anti-sigma factor antagonist n=1 Tax=Baekduia soli TaxID=496014 RepID=A0A5B8U2H1_9ACTN|nr:STAS domain-containing protein [Baekduia soli]QEC47227.1 STAS domain-containing protein [Baekduia soli]
MSFDESRFSITEQALDASTSVFSVAGEIHVTTAPQFGAVLTEAVARGRTSMVIDLTAVGFIDSTGLSVLLTALRGVTRAGGRMALVCSNPTVLRLFEITRLDATFAIHAELEPACQAVQGAGSSTSGIP